MQVFQTLLSCFNPARLKLEFSKFLVVVCTMPLFEYAKTEFG